MDDQSGELKEEEVMDEGIDESGIEKLVWRWRGDIQSWFQRQGEAYRKVSYS